MTDVGLARLVFVAGALHFLQIPGMLVALRTLGVGSELRSLPPLVHRMVVVMAGGIVLCVLGLGLVVTCWSEQVATTRLGAALCAFGCVFWGYRSVVQIVLYARLWPPQGTWAHRILALLFPLKTLVYAACLLLVGSRVG